MGLGICACDPRVAPDSMGQDISFACCSVRDKNQLEAAQSAQSAPSTPTSQTTAVRTATPPRPAAFRPSTLAVLAATAPQPEVVPTRAPQSVPVPATPPQTAVLYSTPKPVRQHCRFGARCRRSDPWHWVEESHTGDPDWPPSMTPAPPVIPPEDNLQDRNGSYEWIRYSNGHDDREQRCVAAEETVLACLGKGYDLGAAGSSVKLLRIDQMVNGTRILTSRDLGLQAAGQNPKVPRSQALRLAVAPEPLALDAALAKAAQGERVAVVSAASAYHPCGGFRSGGRHAFEEAMCMQTSLALSLQRALLLSQQQYEPVRPPSRISSSGRRWLCYIPEDGVVLSPSVEVFRSSYNSGYRFHPVPKELTAVISVAMPNCNSAVRDAPLDAPMDPAEYQELLHTKLCVALGAARLAGASVAVLPGLGCGVYHNDPADVGRALGQALRRLPACGGYGELKEVLLAGVPRELIDAAMGEVR